jgi:predicted anti-sigma-YlaC factor YlaD
MKCKDIQELLKSDYLDCESSRQEKQAVKEHLDQCSICRSLEKELLSQRGIFQRAERLQPPERLWQNIRDAIVSERLGQENSVRPGFLERLRDLIWYKRPAFALASVLAMTLFAAVLTKGIIARQQLSNQNNYREILSVYSRNLENNDSFENMGTSIEEYFL